MTIKVVPPAEFGVTWPSTGTYFYWEAGVPADYGPATGTVITVDITVSGAPAVLTGYCGENFAKVLPVGLNQVSVAIPTDTSSISWLQLDLEGDGATFSVGEPTIEVYVNEPFTPIGDSTPASTVWEDYAAGSGYVLEWPHTSAELMRDVWIHGTTWAHYQVEVTAPEPTVIEFSGGSYKYFEIPAGTTQLEWLGEGDEVTYLRSHRATDQEYVPVEFSEPQIVAYFTPMAPDLGLDPTSDEYFEFGDGGGGGLEPFPYPPEGVEAPPDAWVSYDGGQGPQPITLPYEGLDIAVTPPVGLGRAVVSAAATGGAVQVWIGGKTNGMPLFVQAFDGPDIEFDVNVDLVLDQEVELAIFSADDTPRVFSVSSARFYGEGGEEPPPDPENPPWISGCFWTDIIGLQQDCMGGVPLTVIGETADTGAGGGFILFEQCDEVDLSTANQVSVIRIFTPHAGIYSGINSSPAGCGELVNPGFFSAVELDDHQMTKSFDRWTYLRPQEVDIAHWYFAEISIDGGDPLLTLLPMDDEY